MKKKPKTVEAPEAPPEASAPSPPPKRHAKPPRTPLFQTSITINPPPDGYLDPSPITIEIALFREDDGYGTFIDQFEEAGWSSDNICGNLLLWRVIV
jgi:hypothetical protein